VRKAHNLTTILGHCNPGTLTSWNPLDLSRPVMGLLYLEGRGNGEWRKLHNEELNDLYSSPNIVRLIKSRRMRWAGYVARMGEERGIYRVLLGKPKGRNHWRDLGVDGWIILGWISRRWDVGIWTGLGCPRIETGGGRL